MAGIIRVAFVYPHDLVGEIIDLASSEGKDPSHVAVQVCGGWLEATREGVGVSPMDTYHEGNAIIIPVEVPSPELGEVAGFLMEGDRYSFAGCLEAFVHDKTDLEIPIASNLGKFCSEVVVRVLRCAGKPIKLGEKAKHIEPYHLLAILTV